MFKYLSRLQYSMYAVRLVIYAMRHLRHSYEKSTKPTLHLNLPDIVYCDATVFM